MKLFFKILVIQICGLLAHIQANAQMGTHRGNVSDNGKILTPQNITNYIDDLAGESGSSFDYFWVMADGIIAVNRGVRSQRSPVLVFGSLFDLTRGDCDTEVWQNGV